MDILCHIDISHKRHWPQQVLWKAVVDVPCKIQRVVILLQRVVESYTRRCRLHCTSTTAFYTRTILATCNVYLTIGATLYVSVVTCHHHFFTCNLKFFTHCFFAESHAYQIKHTIKIQFHTFSLKLYDSSL